ncbi:SDR family oxidoreductase [Thalassospira lucentensis]|uniref:SDR family oxidoreductase n=1 Tax=Thalassospira lucentensis TaxID=168935 RepID=UPI003AA7B51D
MADDLDQDKAPTALVTGAASGIGKSIALCLKDKGWSVFVCDADQQAVTSFQQEHPDIRAFLCDVANPQEAGATAAAVLDAVDGKLDLLINNAGIAGMTGAIEDLDVEDFKKTLDVNVNGSFYFLKAVVPSMKKNGVGVVLNIASTAALFGYPNRTPYAAAKWALIGMTKTLAMELGPFGIRVNAVCPGSVEGDRIDGVIARDAKRRDVPAETVRKIYEGQVSMRQFVRTDDIAQMCAFLASDGARMVSGQVIAVDGHTESLSVPI